ncbi:protein SFI1 homolog isoform X2 [Puntigrus tetrazona]|uniref:protein SFI1 homolog isoform X2 n=1 Tax=Puntigrus tetrazona TaxID=1606681 RepID=UPI001C89F516|nr:protein SFI1 homolog isoform X2 [Puntigrus tetrazona]
MWNKNIYSVSDAASGSKNAKRDTRPSDAKAFRSCNTAAESKCVQWKTPERDFTEDSSLSSVSKRHSQPTCFNSADIAYKAHKETLGFQRQDERLSSSTFHELLESSWNSANLHCSMLHYNASEHAVSFVECQTPDVSVSSASSSAVPVISKRERNCITRGIKRQPRRGSSYVPDISIYGKSSNESGENEDFVRDMRLCSNTCAFGGPTEVYMDQAMQRVSLRGACKPHRGLEGSRNERVCTDGQYFVSQQQHSPFKCKPITATEAQLDVAPEAQSDEKKIQERCEDLYKFRLQLRCLRMWSNRLRLLSQARCNDRRRALSKALYALRWAVNMHRAQTDAVERRRSAFLLCQSFYQWKNRCESRHLKISLHDQRNTEALRKRLIQPRRASVVMSTCSSCRNLPVLRTAVIHHHLSVLYKHWLLWRQVCLKRSSGRLQGWWACVWWDRRLQSRAWTLWTLTWQWSQLATHQYRRHVLSSAWKDWKIRNGQKRLEKLIQSIQRSNLLHFFHLWKKRAETLQKDRGKEFVLSQRTLHSWHCSVQKKKLTRLSGRAQWTLSRRMLAVTFRKWRDVSESTRDTRRCLERVHLLQEKGRLRAAFAVWRQSAGLRKELRRIGENSQRAQLSRCLSAWRTLVQCSALLHQKKALILKTCFQHWSRSLQLHALHKRFLIQSHTRHKSTGWEKLVAHKMEVFRWKTGTSAEGLSTRLLLHNALQKWKEIFEKHRLAKSAHDRALQRAVLLEWYRRAQAAFSRRVLLFRDRLARLHPLMSTAVPQGQLYLLRVLSRMMHPDLSLAFSEWSSLVRTNRERRLQADLRRNSRRCEELTAVFRVWRAQTQMHRRAVRHWERRVLFQSVFRWKQMVWQRLEKHLLEQQAAVTRDTSLLTHCFSTWTRLAVGPHCEWQKSAAELMRSRTDKHRLNVSFSTWVTCARQQQTGRAFYTHTLQKSVFLGWLSCVQVCKQRQALALFFTHSRLLRVCFCQWRIICAEQRLAISKAQHTLHLRAKAILQQWRKHTHLRVSRYALLCECEERRKTAVKRRTFLKWNQAVEHFRGIQHYHQRALKHRCFSQWLRELRRRSELLRVSRELEDVWTQTLQRRAVRLCLSVWGERLAERKTARLSVLQWRVRNAFLCWKTAFRQRLRSRDHWTQKEQRRALSAWHRQTVTGQRLRYREACFQYSREMSLQAAVFMQWRRALIQGERRQCALESLLIIHQNRVGDQEPKTITAFNCRLLHKWFRHWTHSRDLLKAADAFYMKKRRNKARFVLSTWSRWAKECKAQRQMGEAVGLWLEGRAVSRSFRRWVKVYQDEQKASHHRQTLLSHGITEVERRGEQGLTRLYWTCWKNQTEASLLYTQQYECSVLQRAWLTWRKRRIRNRVSGDCSAAYNKVLLAQVLRVWWQRAHRADSEP